MRDSVVVLPGENALAFAEYGEPDGHPVFFFHGTPGSRLQDPSAIGAGAYGTRVIAVDRPGYGRSTFHAGWGLTNWADDVAALADRLRIGRFSIVAVSGGGPYAAACAARIPDRLVAVGLVSSPAPALPDRRGADQERGATEGLDEFDVAARTLDWPAFLAWREATRGSTPPDVEVMLQPDSNDIEADLRVLAHPAVQSTLRLTLPEAFRQGVAAYAYDWWLTLRPWGFEPAAIEAPVHLWHGLLDTRVPVGDGQYLAAEIPNCHATWLPDTGHFLAPEYWPTIWAALMPGTR